jgi:uncharacterized membrane protein required for colicin V production
MTWWMWDLIVIAVMAYFIWRGWKKGLILGIAGIIIVFIAIWGAGRLADRSSDWVAENFSQLIGMQAETVSEGRQTPAVNNENGNKSEAENRLLDMGVSSRDISHLVNEIWDNMQETGESLTRSLQRTATRLAARVVCFIFFFVVLSIALHIVLRLVRQFFKLPVFKQIDKTAGLCLGVLLGLLVLFSIGWILRYSSFALTADQLNETVLLRIFAYNNPLLFIIGR